VEETYWVATSAKKGHIINCLLEGEGKKGGREEATK